MLRRSQIIVPISILSDGCKFQPHSVLHLTKLRRSQRSPTRMSFTQLKP